MKLFLEELENFPLCASKDWVDAFVHALSYCSRPAEFAPQKIEAVQQYSALPSGYEEGRSTILDEDFDNESGWL